MKELSEITKLKVLILEQGVKFFPIDLFSSNDKNYKMKTINKHPVSNGKEVYDISDDNNLVPSEILLKLNERESLVKCRYNNNSTVELFYEFDKLKIKVNENISNVTCELVPKYDFLKTKVNDMYCVDDYVDIVGMDRISILLFEGCYNWVCGKQCKFCDLHPKRICDKTPKPTINTLHTFKNVEEWWTFYKKDYFENIKKSLQIIISQKKLKHMHLFIMAGNLTNASDAWKCLLDLVEYLSTNFDMSLFDSYVNVCPHATLQDIYNLKKYGIKQIQYNLEVSNSNIFSEMCPGKVNFDTFVQKLYEGVKVFGKGNVRSNMVLGLQDIDELLIDAEKFANAGIVFDYSVFQPKKYTPLEKKPSPTMEEVIYFSTNLAKIYKKYAMKPIFCSVGSRSSIINEVFDDTNSRTI